MAERARAAGGSLTLLPRTIWRRSAAATLEGNASREIRSRAPGQSFHDVTPRAAPRVVLVHGEPAVQLGFLGIRRGDFGRQCGQPVSESYRPRTTSMPERSSSTFVRESLPTRSVSSDL